MSTCYGSKTLRITPVLVGRVWGFCSSFVMTPVSLPLRMRSEPTRVVFTYLRPKKQNKQHCNCLALFSPSLVLSLSHKFVKHGLFTPGPLETCHVEICTLSTKTCHHSSIGSDAVSQRPLVDNAYIVPLQIATTSLSLGSLVNATLVKGLVCISAVLSPLSTLTASPPVRSRESVTKPRQTR